MTSLVVAPILCYYAGMKTDELKERLSLAYPGAYIEVRDLTEAGSNFQVEIESEKFTGQNRIQQHQAVMAVFDAELKSGEIHALTIKTKIKED